MKPDLLVYGNAIADHQNRKKKVFEGLPYYLAVIPMVFTC